MNKGVVKWFHVGEGFGFITPDDGGEELFVHHSEFINIEGNTTLEEGQQVSYEIGPSLYGPCAKNVALISPQSVISL